MCTQRLLNQFFIKLPYLVATNYLTRLIFIMHKTTFFTLIFIAITTCLAQAQVPITEAFTPENTVQNRTVAPDLTCSEINYNSHPSRASGNWLELHNYGNVSINLGGFRLKEEGTLAQFLIPANTIIPPGGYLVFADDVTQFQSVFPNVTNVTGPTGIALGNNGDTVQLLDNTFAEVLRIGYLDNLPWPQCADGAGRTLENRNPNTNTGLLAPANWRDGCMGGSPGTGYSACTEPIFFNEINYKSNNFGDAGDWVEVWNRSGQAVDMSGWQLRDRNDTLRFTITNGTIVPKDSFLVFYSDLFLFNDVHPGAAPNKVGPFLFGLSGNGDILRLFDQNKDIVLSMSYNDAAPWPTEPDGQGPTLELRAPFTDLNTPTNWAASCNWGTPGRKNSPCSSGTNDLYHAPNIKIAPNPSSDRFQINIEQQATTHWQLLDLNGRSLRTGTAAQGQWTIDATPLPPACYLLRMQGEGWNTVVRLVKN